MSSTRQLGLVDVVGKQPGRGRVEARRLDRDADPGRVELAREVLQPAHQTIDRHGLVMHKTIGVVVDPDRRMARGTSQSSCLGWP